MPRGLRIYEKKRGHRRTGSTKLGVAGEALFFAVLLAAGAGVFAGLLYGVVLPEWRVNHEFVEHTSLVLDKRVAERENGDDRKYRPEVKVRYTVDGRPLTAWTYDIATAAGAADSYSADRDEAARAIGPFARGEEVRCWYDPTQPETVVLVRGYRWWVWAVLALPVLFVLIGAGGLLFSLLHWHTSAERRAILARRAAARELLRGNGRAAPEYPTVPEEAGINDSPGTKLRYRLPIATSPGWALFGTFLGCAGWNGTLLLVMAVNGHFAGIPDWSTILFLLPFAAVGALLVAALVRQLLRTTGVGPTQVELSDHPLHPGARYEVFISQSGRLPLDSLELQLRCEEQATYREGTNTRTETRGVYAQRLYCGEDLKGQRSAPFQATCELVVPPGVMHSFKSEHNSVTWRLVVQGRLAGRRDYRRDYPVIVFPAEQTNGHD